MAFESLGLRYVPLTLTLTSPHRQPEGQGLSFWVVFPRRFCEAHQPSVTLCSASWQKTLAPHRAGRFIVVVNASGLCDCAGTAEGVLHGSVVLWT